MTVIEHDGVRIETHPDVYEPAEDTWLLARSIPVRPGTRVLEVGTGSGAVAIHCARRGADVVATDLSPAALRLASKNARRNGVRIQFLQADLLQGLRASAFDVVAFNPPYLPTESGERVPGPLNLAFDGGISGRDTLQRFLRGLRIGARTVVLAAVSSLQDRAAVENLFEASGLDAEAVADERFPFEAVTIFSLRATRGRGIPV